MRLCRRGKPKPLLMMLKVFAWRHFAHVYASTTEGNFLPPQKPQLCRALNRFLSMFFCVVCSDPVQKSNTHLPSFIISPLPLTTPPAYRPPPLHKWRGGIDRFIWMGGTLPTSRSTLSIYIRYHSLRRVDIRRLGQSILQSL